MSEGLECSWILIAQSHHDVLK